MLTKSFLVFKLFLQFHSRRRRFAVRRDIWVDVRSFSDSERSAVLGQASKESRCLTALLIKNRFSLSFVVVQIQALPLHYLLSSNANRASLTKHTWDLIRPPLAEHFIQHGMVRSPQFADFLPTFSWPILLFAVSLLPYLPCWLQRS